MKKIWFAQADTIYNDVVSARNSAAKKMASLIEGGEDGDELLKAAAAFRAYSDIASDIESLERNAELDAKK